MSSCKGFPSARRLGFQANGRILAAFAEWFKGQQLTEQAPPRKEPSYADPAQTVSRAV
ncbi:hypothetical protein kuro4_14750 [Gelria sp. Kuro-4]|nr:hypothetical protein kuro4_14750 [Gelria sp. Kuro-4]